MRDAGQIKYNSVYPLAVVLYYKGGGLDERFSVC